MLWSSPRREALAGRIPRFSGPPGRGGRPARQNPIRPVSMFRNFFRKQNATPRREQPPELPPGVLAYAIGDIHGRADLLAALEPEIQADAARRPPGRRLLVYLGDYVDRGHESRQVLDRLLQGPPAGFEAIYLKGNHEAAMLDFLVDPAVGPGWLQYGGDATLLSYGVRPNQFPMNREGMIRLQAELRRCLPDRHLSFLRGLALRHIEGDYAFVHAGVRPGLSVGQQSEDDLLWIRDPFLTWPDPLDKIIVHGHSITEEPEIRINRIGIDTGAFATSRLTALGLFGAERWFLST